jgi:aryl-alcohol dehydrogenase-like predicted oxidoreductase
MEYRYLGKTGLQVSCIGFGNMINFKDENLEVDDSIIKRAIEHNINYFDTAEMFLLYFNR